MSNAEIDASSRLPRAIAAGSVPCLNSVAFRLICTSNSPGALLSSDSLNTVHILPCQSSGTAGVEMRSGILVWAWAGSAASVRLAAERAAASASRPRRAIEGFGLRIIIVSSPLSFAESVFERVDRIGAQLRGQLVVLASAQG